MCCLRKWCPLHLVTTFTPGRRRERGIKQIITKREGHHLSFMATALDVKVCTWWWWRRWWVWRAGLISEVEAGCGTEREEAGESPGPGTSVSPPGEAGQAGEGGPAGSPGSWGTGGRTWNISGSQQPFTPGGGAPTCSESGVGSSSLSEIWLMEILTGSRTQNLKINYQVIKHFHRI